MTNNKQQTFLNLMEDLKQSIEKLLGDAERREREAKPNSWQRDEAAGEVKMARKILEEMG